MNDRLLQKLIAARAYLARQDVDPVTVALRTCKCAVCEDRRHQAAVRDALRAMRAYQQRGHVND